MGRTAEQKAADDALRAAIEGVLKAYELLDAPTPMLLTEYVVITCHRGFEDGGEGNARYNWTVQDDGMPWHHIFGLLDEGRKQMLRDQDGSFRRDED